MLAVYEYEVEVLKGTSGQIGFRRFENEIDAFEANLMGVGVRLKGGGLARVGSDCGVVGLSECKNDR